MEKIGNNYGAALTAQDVVEMFSQESGWDYANGSNLAMRFFLNGRGFSRVSRAFADEVIGAEK